MSPKEALRPLASKPRPRDDGSAEYESSREAFKGLRRKMARSTRQLQPQPLSATDPPPIAPSCTACTCPAAGPSRSDLVMVGFAS
jgi:hypothetical protein